MGGFWPKATAVALVLVIVAGGLAAYFWKKCAQPPLQPITVTKPKPDTVFSRPDTVEVASPALLGRISTLRARLAAFLADSGKEAATCIALLTQAAGQIESLEAALALPPAVRLTLADSSLPYIHPSVHYEGKGTQGVSSWEFTHIWAKYPRFTGGGAGTRGVGRVGFGGGFSFSGTVNARFGLRLRLKQSLIVGADKNLGRAGWGVELGYFLF